MESHNKLPDVKARIEQASKVAGSANEFCAIAPGLQQMFTGLQSILDNSVSDPKSKSIIDGIFGAAILALQMAQSMNCGSR
jgi:hypothetical protein